MTNLAAPMISDDLLLQIKTLLRNGFGLLARDQEALFSEFDRLRDHNAYLTTLFYGIADLKRCEPHRTFPSTPDEYDFVVAPRCDVCLANDLRAMVAGNVDATTLAERYRQQSARNLSLVIENARLKAGEETGEAP